MKVNLSLKTKLYIALGAAPIVVVIIVILAFAMGSGSGGSVIDASAEYIQSIKTRPEGKTLDYDELCDDKLLSCPSGAWQILLKKEGTFTELAVTVIFDGGAVPQECTLKIFLVTVEKDGSRQDGGEEGQETRLELVSAPFGSDSSADAVFASRTFPAKAEDGVIEAVVTDGRGRRQSHILKELILV